MNSLRVISTVLIGACAAVIFAQGSGDVASKRSDLERLRGAIRESEERVKRLDGEARKSAAAIEEYRRQALALDSLVHVLHEEEGRLASEMIALRERRDSLGDQVATLRAKYAKRAKALFKNRLLTTSASVLLLPHEHGKLAMRQRLFERYARAQRKQAHTIAAVSGALAGDDSLLRVRQSEQLAVIAEKRAEMERLFDLQRAHAATLQEASSQRSALKSEIERKNAEAGKISEMIARLAREGERANDGRRTTPSNAEPARAQQKNGAGGKEGSAAQKVSPKGSATTTSGAASAKDAKGRAASEMKGSESSPDGRSPKDAKPRPKGKKVALRFIWPTTGRKIVEAYGERVNPETGTVTINPGINIAARSGSAVVASESGVVSLVSWLPSYGTIVIVEHRDGYRTVYGNLAAAAVSRGANVRAGQKIGSVGGGWLHFEIWREQTRLNPTTVLR